jgi:hypothetical protein
VAGGIYWSHVCRDADIVYRGEETRGKERETYKDRKERDREIEK